MTSSGSSSTNGGNREAIDPAARRAAGALLFLATLVRLYYAYDYFLNPDEAMHFHVVAKPSWDSVFAAAGYQHHPPLFALFSHALLPLGISEFSLRLPHLVLGVLSLAFAFRWLELTFGSRRALAGLALLVCSPAMVAAASEFRHTSLLLFFLTASLLSAERLHLSPRWRYLILLYLSLAGALLSHYSSVFGVAAIALVASLRMLIGNRNNRIFAVWIISQIALLILGYWALFGFGHAFAGKALRDGEPYLQQWYFDGNREGAWRFMLDRWQQAISYLAGERWLGSAIAVVALAGSLLAAFRQRAQVTLLSAAIVTTVTVAALGRYYPLGPIRHISHLLPFVAAAFAAGTPRVLLRSWIILPLALWWLIGTAPPNSIDQVKRSYLDDAIAYLKREVPADSVIFTDFQTQRILAHRLAGRDQPIRQWLGPPSAADSHIDSWYLVEPNFLFALDRHNIMPVVLETARLRGKATGDELWLMSIGWENPHPFTDGLPATAVVSSAQFGTIRVVRARIPNS